MQEAGERLEMDYMKKRRRTLRFPAPADTDHALPIEPSKGTGAWSGPPAGIASTL